MCGYLLGIGYGECAHDMRKQRFNTDNTTTIRYRLIIDSTLITRVLVKCAKEVSIFSAGTMPNNHVKNIPQGRDRFEETDCILFYRP